MLKKISEKLIYDVEMDIAKLLSGDKQPNTLVNKIENKAQPASNIVNFGKQALLSLSTIAMSLEKSLSAQTAIKYSNIWINFNNTLSHVVRGEESLVSVAERVFKITQDTRSNLQATSALYTLLERGTQELNLPVADLIRLTETINRGLMLSASRQQEAETLITQLSLNIRVEQPTDTVIQNRLAIESAVNVLLSQSENIRTEYAAITATGRQVLQMALTNMAKFFGNTTTVPSTLAVFKDSIVRVSDKLEATITAVTAATWIYGNRDIGTLAISAKPIIGEAIEKVYRAKLATDAIGIELRRADVANAVAREELNQIEAQYLTTHYEEGAGIAAAEAAIAAKQRYQSSMESSLLAAAALALALDELQSSLVRLGGSMEAAATVVAGWYLFVQNQLLSRKESIAFANTLPDVISKLSGMTLSQAQQVRADTVSSIKNQQQDIADLEKHIADLNSQYIKKIELAMQMGGYDEHR